MTPREIENKHTFNAIADECEKIENDLSKLQEQLFAVGLASLATTLGYFADRTKKIRNYAAPENPYKYTKENTPAFTGVA